MNILVTGASGLLGGYVLRELRQRNVTPVAWGCSRCDDRFGISLRPVDLTNRDQVAAAFRVARPDAVLHAAAMASVAACHARPELAGLVNTRGSALLAELAEERRTRLILVSTDLVFDGERAPYSEASSPAPLSVYGRTKLAAEQAVLAYSRHAVARVSLLFGPALFGGPSFFDTQVDALNGGRQCSLFQDEWRTPLALPVAAAALIDLLDSDVSGVLHLGGSERLSRLEMGLRLAALLGRDPAQVLIPASRESGTGAESRPRDVSLDSTRWRSLSPDSFWPGYEEAVAAMLKLDPRSPIFPIA